MKKNELAEVKAMDLKELKMKANSLKEEIAGLTMDKNMKKMKDLKQISKKRKDLARVLTVATQKQLLAQLESNEALANKVADEKSDKKTSKGKQSLPTDKQSLPKEGKQSLPKGKSEKGDRTNLSK